MELSKEYTTENDISTRNEKKTTITYTNTTFFGADCKKEYVFFDNKLSICIFDVDTSHWMPKDIYEELVKLNGEPDETDVKPDDKYHYNIYTWYGKNGTLGMVEDKSTRSIEVIFQLKEQ